MGRLCGTMERHNGLTEDADDPVWTLSALNDSTKVLVLFFYLRWSETSCSRVNDTKETNTCINIWRFLIEYDLVV